MYWLVSKKSSKLRAPNEILTVFITKRIISVCGFALLYFSHLLFIEGSFNKKKLNDFNDRNCRKYSVEAPQTFLCFFLCQQVEMSRLRSFLMYMTAKKALHTCHKYKDIIIYKERQMWLVVVSVDPSEAGSACFPHLFRRIL